MTTPNNHSNTGKLERLLDGLQRKLGDLGATVRAMSERVVELADTTDAIYEAVSYQRDSPPYHAGPDDYLNGLDE